MKEQTMSEEEKILEFSGNISPLFKKRHKKWENEPQTDISLMNAPINKGDILSLPHKPAPDLTSKQKAIFLVGPGGTGKTMFARWSGWKMAIEGRQAMLCALDPQNRSLATWFDNVQQPPTTDGSQSARWLRDTLMFQMEEQLSAIYDFGGGDVALSQTIESIPDLISLLQTEKIEPVLLYFISPRIDDLAIMNHLERLEFQPEATAIIMNESRIDSAITLDEAFGRTLNNNVFRNIMARGAIPLVMPRLEQEVASEIEGKRLTFGMARDGTIPENASIMPLGPFERSMTRRWLANMENRFAPIASWLP